MSWNTLKRFDAGFLFQHEFDVEYEHPNATLELWAESNPKHVKLDYSNISGHHRYKVYVKTGKLATFFKLKFVGVVNEE
jgi:hypothetical protein